MAVTGSASCLYKPGEIVTCEVTAAVTVGTVVAISGTPRKVATAASKSTKVIGIALQTASASGDLIAVQLLVYIFSLKAKGAVTAGDQLVAGSDGLGTVTTLAAASTATATDINDARSVIGVALADIADGSSGQVAVRV